MRVAVLMSSYNGGKYITEQIESVLAQCGDFQLDLWVRDDGSKDETQEILQSYAQQGKLQWYAGENLQAAHSFMDLLIKCRGYDYYAFADQDDYWKPEKIQAGIKALSGIDEDTPALYFANAELVDSDLLTLGRNVYKYTPKTDFKTLSCAGGYLGCTMIFNSALATLIQDKPMPGKILMHDFYVAEVCSAFGGKIVSDPESHMKYRQHGDNVVGVKQGTFGKLLREVRSKNSVGIADQAQSILALYSGELPKEAEAWLEKVSKYRELFAARLYLAGTRQTRYMNLYAGIRLRLQILFGNR